jgi:hypothetical protein
MGSERHSKKDTSNTNEREREDEEWSDVTAPTTFIHSLDGTGFNVLTPWQETDQFSKPPSFCKYALFANHKNTKRIPKMDLEEKLLKWFLNMNIYQDMPAREDQSAEPPKSRTKLRMKKRPKKNHKYLSVKLKWKKGSFYQPTIQDHFWSNDMEQTPDEQIPTTEGVNKLCNSLPRIEDEAPELISNPEEKLTEWLHKKQRQHPNESSDDVEVRKDDISTKVRVDIREVEKQQNARWQAKVASMRTIPEPLLRRKKNGEIVAFESSDERSTTSTWEGSTSSTPTEHTQASDTGTSIPHETTRITI